MKVTACKGLALTYGTDYKAFILVPQGSVWEWNGQIRERMKLKREFATIEITYEEFKRFFNERGSDEIPEATNENE